ncbi:DUF669 domain-containing protein [Enterococcus hulanensis]|uniref:DUF669 domain-containing protein n=1 Tax=Enterococcus hulanensis TaxID=2559929 RepID=UPI001A8DDBF9|nr:DUF669 domain-containing protein [Enterococcus hulanensis]MBO0460070.1 DUF669 domain-containing protein [Enterococcus hulanensis]
MVLFTTDSTNVFGKFVEEAGSYNVVILQDSEYKLTNDKTKEMAVLNYEVVDGQYAGGKILYNNIVWDNGDIELSKKRFNTLLAAIGVPDGTPIESLQYLVQAVKGKKLNVTVEWQENTLNGKWNLNVKRQQKTDLEGSKPNGIKRPNEQQITQQRQNEINSAANMVAHNNTFQETLPGVDPVRDTRSFANGGFNNIDISDDDLPF